MNTGTELELTVEKLVSGGNGLARVADAGNFVVFVERGLPGQRVRVRLSKVKKAFAEAQILKVLEQSPHAVDPPCEHAAVCGGCLWQGLEYAEQLRWKRELVLDHLARVPGCEDLEVGDIIPSPDVFGFRNKMEFAFSGGKGDKLHLGLREHGSRSVVDVTGCLLQSGRCMDIVDAARGFCRRTGVPAYSQATRKGFWRFLVVRETIQGDMLAHIISSGEKSKRWAAEELAEFLLEAFEGLAVVHSSRQARADVAQGERLLRAWGPNSGRIEETLSNLHYAIPPDGFFQTNTRATEKLYNVVREYVLSQGPDIGMLWDVYCGVGGIGLQLADLAGEIKGFDIDRQAIREAGRNAQRNNILNSAFRAGQLFQLLERENTDPDVVVTDPPRSGMDAKTTRAILERKPKAIIYVSCNPATQARDLALLMDDYAAEAAQPVDLFPHSPHVENVVLLRRK